MFQTPILLITFNRPEHTLQVLNEIKKLKPQYLFVFQDSPRIDKSSDLEKCSKVRNIINDSIDWSCELNTFYPNINLGCGKGPSSAISWFFDQVEMGIILEDDCLPHPDFFHYCEKLLLKFKDNEKISFIGGSSFQESNNTYDSSFYFASGSFGTWGWASWKRAWKNFDYYIEQIDNKIMKSITKQYFKDCRQRNYWMEIFESVKENQFNDSCWDYQFYFACWQKNMLAIIPNKNLISNIGYDYEGTHTLSSDHPAANLKTSTIFPLVFPKEEKLNIKSDFYVFKTYTLPYEYGISGFKRLPFRINKRIKKIFNHKGSWLKNNFK